ELFRAEILRRIAETRSHGFSHAEAVAALFPHTVLPTETYEDLVAALVSGAHLLFFGPSGAGKTSLAKELWGLFPKELWVVEGCPVGDDPLSLVSKETAERFPPCPICRRRFSPGGEVAAFDPALVDASKVPAVRVRRREGYGFARLQGSSEVFPDHLTGNVNLRKLEEIGDPMSPLVLEPGKLLQANRGLLLVDEIGKLPLGTQNVLLQSLQEGTVTPSKSRESFPALFVAICTSNLSDLDNINDPLSDRLTSLHVGFNTRHAANRQIVDRARAETPSGYVPEILLDAGVRMIEAWRLRMSEEDPDMGEVGSNRTLLDVIARTEAYGTLGSRSVPTLDDLRAGLLHAMRGRIRARSGDSFHQNARRVQEFLDQHLETSLKDSAKVYWCRYFRDVLKAKNDEAQALIGEGRRLLPDALLQTDAKGKIDLFPRFHTFATYVQEREGPPATVGPWPAAVSEFGLVEKYSLFSCAEEPTDDGPAG
ncbi:MAG TPA: ATP-binding protein, partial [Thermoplasmata archaeon]|nr:ATP-binding protein [Thermoplasmata archaeon]